MKKRMVSFIVGCMLVLGLLPAVQAEAAWKVVENDDPLVAYSGGWSVWADSGDNGGSASVSDGSIGRSIQYVFYGSAVEVYGRKHTWGGVASIVIDDGEPETVDVYDASGSWVFQQKLFSKEGLADEAHTLTITVTAQHEGASGASRFFLDYIRVQSEHPAYWTQVAGNDDSLTVSTGWNYWADEGDLTGGVRVSDGQTGEAANRFISMDFFGTDVLVMGRYHSLGGLVEVFIDGESSGEIDQYTSGTEQKKQLLFAVRGLTPGAHTIRLFAKGASPQSTSGNRILLDCFMWANRSNIEPDVLNWTTIENTDSRVIYNTDMQIWTDAAHSGGSESVSNDVVGNSAELTFYGSQIVYIAQKHTMTGVVSVYIDGVFQCDVDTYGSYLKQVRLFEKNDLEEGVHTIKLVLKSGSEGHDNSCRLTLDCFKVGAYTMRYRIGETVLQDGKASVKVEQLGNNPKMPMLLFAFFDEEGCLLKVRTVAVEAGKTDYSDDAPEGAAAARAFLWKDFASLLPVL